MIPADHSFDLERYARRIGYRGRLDASLATVDALMQHQLGAIAFENLDVLAGIPISLEPAAIVDKLLHRQRGGYCFELNGLFALALGALGVEYRLLAARPLVGGRKPRLHVAIAVEIGGKRWLCDLGFGRYGIRRPLDLALPEVEQSQDHDRFMLREIGTGTYRLRASVEGDWVDQFEFDLEAQQWIDFAPANHYCSTHPDSLFVNHLVALVYTPRGRKILMDDRLTSVEGGDWKSRRIAAAAIGETLGREFGLDPGDLDETLRKLIDKRG